MEVNKLMVKKIQVTLPSKIAKDAESVIADEGHDSFSEFGRFCIQDYLMRKQYGLIKPREGLEPE